MDRITDSKIVLASGNPHKLDEIQAVLGSGLDLVCQGDLGIGPVEETGLTFVENAILKARHASLHSGLPALADDSGLEVDALHGRPGIHSSRFAGERATDAENNARLLEMLQDVDPSRRQARFQCVIVYLRHAEDPVPVIASGTWHGVILRQPTGDAGFGYDPLFFVPPERQAVSEMGREKKNRLSHRALALKQLREQLDLA